MMKTWRAVAAVGVVLVAAITMVVAQETPVLLRGLTSGCTVSPPQGQETDSPFEIQCIRVEDDGTAWGFELECHPRSQRQYIRYFAGPNDVVVADLGKLASGMVPFRMLGYSSSVRLAPSDIARITRGDLAFETGPNTLTFSPNAEEVADVQRCLAQPE